MPCGTQIMIFDNFVLDDNGHWVENNEVFMFPGYVLDDNGHWTNNEDDR